MIDDDEIDMALTGAADDADEAAQKRARRGKLWLIAPAKNSPEIELRAAKYEDDPAPVDIEFGDETDTEKVAADPELIRDSHNHASLYDFHISLARCSLGEGATWDDYKAACQREGVEPMPQYSHRSRR